MPERSMIAAHRLTRQFGRIRAVDALDFAIPAGQVVGFLGHNGAGKTTTIRMIAGYLPPTSGSASVDGLDVASNWREVRKRIGYLPESAPLYTEMRVEEYLRFRAKLFGLARARRKSAVELALRRCAIEDVRKRPINQLSKGYRQRVGLAAAMLHEPPVLILDEPTVGLDPSQIRQVRSLIRELAGEHTILLSTHILPEVELTCDRIIMIARGRIRADGTIDELRQRAAGPGASRYVIESDSPAAEAAVGKIGGISSIDSLPIDARWRRITVTANDGTSDRREAIAGVLRDVGASVRELRREAPSLEQLFIQTAAHAEAEYAGGEG